MISYCVFSSLAAVQLKQPSFFVPHSLGQFPSLCCGHLARPLDYFKGKRSPLGNGYAIEVSALPSGRVGREQHL